MTKNLTLAGILDPKIGNTNLVFWTSKMDVKHSNLMSLFGLLDDFSGCFSTKNRSPIARFVTIWGGVSIKFRAKNSQGVSILGDETITSDVFLAHYRSVAGRQFGSKEVNETVRLAASFAIIVAIGHNNLLDHDVTFYVCGSLTILVSVSASGYYLR